MGKTNPTNGVFSVFQRILQITWLSISHVTKILFVHHDTLRWWGSILIKLFFGENSWKHDEKQFCKTMFPYGNTGRITGHFLTTIDINVINLYCRIICCYNFHCCCRQGCNHFLGVGGRWWGRGRWGVGVGGQDPQLFYFPSSNFGELLTWGIGLTHSSWMFFLFSLKSRFFQDFSFNYTPDSDWTIWSSKFRKFSRGLTEPPPQTYPPLFLKPRPQFPDKSNTSV